MSERILTNYVPVCSLLLMLILRRLSALIALVFLILLPTTIHAQVVDPREAKVSLTFDDGFKSTYTLALPILSARGIKAVEFPTTGFIDSGVTGDGFPAMTWAEVQNLQNQYGWEIGSHTLTHPELPTVNLNQIKNELTQSKTILESKGFNVSSLATPYGAYDNNVLREALKIYNLHRGFWDRDDQNIYPYDRSVVLVQSSEQGVTVPNIKSWIDQAVSQKKWLVLVFHDVAPQLNPNYEYTTTTNDLTQIADYIKQKGIKVVTMNHTLTKPGTNLIPNSTFANGIADGWTTDTPAQVQADSGNNGSYPSSTNAIKLLGATKLAKLISASIPIVSGSTYSFQSFVNADLITSGQIAFAIEEYGSGGNLLSTKSLGNVGVDVIKYFSSVYTPASSVSSIKVTTSISGNANGTAYVDNYELYNLSGVNPTSTPSQTPTPTTSVTSTPTPTLTPTSSPSVTPTRTATPTPTVQATLTPTATPSPTGTPANTNLVPNFSFETLTNGWATSWTRDNNSFLIDTTSKGNHGTNSVHLVANTAYAHLFSDKFPVIPGTTYFWKTYLKTIKAGKEFGFYLDEYDTNGVWISGKWMGMIKTNFIGTKQFSYKPSSTRVKTIGLQYYVVPNSTFDLYLDSVVVSK